ncbi:glycosyltransferase [Caulobacter sp. UNC279MFTsu5.1]|uniref:glycosyltransferase n=1 Tax=Caulobacter sp. UNC279MFTsu5.1 TaxID=1502775 RepID=UPI0008F0B3CF|nr:glycosyltransferase [Caulobacter sp. UNC279MFTsu5.1]SFJ70013.1 UDP:flavonoid glycosyltransferase YjiC, YdhE family [Caulobacter sp. UNC279MFTsu5.1]
MRVLLSTFGSRGDVEPMAGLAAALRALGVEAVVCAPPDPEFVALLARAGAPLAPAFTPVRRWVAAALANQPPMDLSQRAAGVLTAQFEAISAAAEGCDAILAAGLFPSTAAARCVAELQGVPYVYAAYCPVFLPSTHHRPLPFPGHPVPADETDNRVLWEGNARTMNAVFGEAFAALRAAKGLPPVDNVRDHVFTDRPWLASDPVLSPWRPTDLRGVVQTGAWILPDERPLPPALEAFLNAGPPPVYVGFGSMPMQALKDAARAAVAAVRAQGRRVLLAHGWADLDLGDDRDDGLAVGDVNQQALFARVAAVVHHGGAGTTTTAARAGAPQVVVPQIADQPYFAGRVADLGVGVAHEGPAPTVESLSAALESALVPEVRTRARDLAGAIRSDGARVAAERLLDVIGRR